MKKLSLHVPMSFSLFFKKKKMIGKEADKFNSAFIIFLFYEFCVPSSEKTISSLTIQQFNNHASSSMTTQVVQ